MASTSSMRFPITVSRLVATYLPKNKGYLTASVHSFATSVAHMYSPDVTIADPFRLEKSPIRKTATIVMNSEMASGRYIATVHFLGNF